MDLTMGSNMFVYSHEHKNAWKELLILSDMSMIKIYFSQANKMQTGRRVDISFSVRVFLVHYFIIYMFYVDVISLD